MVASIAHPLKVSVAVPLHNEEAVLPELLQRTSAVLDQLPGGPHELILVDDGSSDRTLELACNASQQDSRLVVVSLSRNFGQQAAYSAGLQYVSGEAVVLMDGDLQDAPEEIPRMLETFHEGYDVVYAVRVHRKESLLLRLCYFFFYKVITALAKVRLPRDAGDFCVISRRVADEISRAPEQLRYLRGLRAWIGFKQIGIPVERNRRVSGESKYSWRRLFGLAFDGIFAFSVLPVRFATLLGCVSMVLSFSFGSYYVIDKMIQGDAPQGFTSTIIFMMFFAGVQLMFLGVIGEYVGRIYEEVKGRPRFIVDQVVRRKSDAEGKNAQGEDFSEKLAEK